MFQEEDDVVMKRDVMDEVEFLKQKAKLREYYKKIKAGIITIEDVPDDYKILLQRYYGMF